MARYDMTETMVGATAQDSSEVFLRLGMMYSTGRSVPADLITAHKWFNLAALKGNDEAKRYRSEVSEEMSREEIAEAQRAARQWMTTH